MRSFAKLTQRACSTLIEGLEKYTVPHFRAEETMVRISGDPERGRHKNSHGQ